jgi:hypothetical protein
MGTRGQIDREKHETDVLERVIKGIRAETDHRTPSHTADHDVRPRLGGHVVSAAHIQVVDNSSED